MKIPNKNTFSLFLFLILMMSMVQFTAPTDGTQSSSLTQIDETKTTHLAYLDHEPIWVDGDDDFVTQAASEGWTGDGSAGSPIIITGYHILTTSTQPFRVWNTDLYWEIRGNNATTETAFCGTWIQNTTHGVIADNIFHDLHAGMIIGEVEGLTIENNEIRDTTAIGIEVLNGLTNSTIRNNNIHNIAFAGIVIPDAEDVLISGNSISEIGGYGIQVKSGVNNTIYNNEISQTDFHGIKIDRSCYETTVSNNIIQDTIDGISCSGDFNEFYQNTIRDSSGTGIKVDYVEITSTISINNTFYDNTVINCSEYSVDISEECSNNTFTGNDFFEVGYSNHVNDDGMDNVFTKNFYDTWIGPDDDVDGYVDTPYVMVGTDDNLDMQPLAEPCNPIPEGYDYVPIEMPDATTSDTPSETIPSETIPSETDPTDTGNIPPMDIIPIAIIGAVAVVMVVGIIVAKRN